jgi:hypothetical protein
MARKRYDIVAKVGEYTNNQGVQKPRWQNVGAVIDGDKGPFMVLEPWIDLAGLPREQGKGVLLNLFDPNQNQQGHQQSNAPASTGNSQGESGASADFDDDIPF